MQLWKYSAYVPSQIIIKDFHQPQKANYTRPLPPPVIITFCSSQLSNSFFVWIVYNFCCMSAVLLMFNALMKISFLTRWKNIFLNGDPVPEFWRALDKFRSYSKDWIAYQWPYYIVCFDKSHAVLRDQYFYSAILVGLKKLCP